MPQEYINIIFSFNTFVFVLNIVIFIFGKKILTYLDTSDLEGKDIGDYKINSINKQKKFLLIINILIFIGYFISLFLNLDIINSFIKVMAVIVFAFFMASILVRFIVYIYGEKVNVNKESYIKKGYKTRIFSLLSIIIVIIIASYVIIDILGFQDWIQNGGFVGGLLAFLGFTASVWATDMFSSILILHSNKVDLGDVVEFDIDGIKKFAFIKHINLSEVTLTDLVYHNLIILRSSEFRDLKIINRSKKYSGSRTKYTNQIIEAKIGYEYNLEEIQSLYKYAIETMIKDYEDKKERKYFPKEINYKVDIKDFGDFAIVYQLYYEISSPFYMIKALKLLNIYLQKAQHKFGIYFSTPELFIEQKCK